MKRRHLRRVLLLTLMLSQAVTWSIFGTQAPQWLQAGMLAISAMLALMWVAWR